VLITSRKSHELSIGDLEFDGPKFTKFGDNVQERRHITGAPSFILGFRCVALFGKQRTSKAILGQISNFFTSL